MGGDGIPTAFDARKLRASARSEERTSFESYSCQKTNKKNPSGYDGFFLLVGGDGFEPSKRDATDLQSAPFGHSGTLPYEVVAARSVMLVNGAGGRIKTLRVFRACAYAPRPFLLKTRPRRLFFTQKALSGFESY